MSSKFKKKKILQLLGTEHLVHTIMEHDGKQNTIVSHLEFNTERNTIYNQTSKVKIILHNNMKTLILIL